MQDAGRDGNRTIRRVPSSRGFLCLPLMRRGSSERPSRSSQRGRRPITTWPALCCSWGGRRKHWESSLDILNRVDGISFDEAIQSGDGFELEGRRVPVIGLKALLRNKRAAGREQDLADLKALEAAARRSNEEQEG